MRSDRGLLWLNNLFLMLAAFLPFPAALLGEYGDQQIIIVLYAATLLLTGGCLSLLWYYCTHDRRLVNPQMSRKLVRMVHVKILILPAVVVGAVWISFFSPRGSASWCSLEPSFFISFPVLRTSTSTSIPSWWNREALSPQEARLAERRAGEPAGSERAWPACLQPLDAVVDQQAGDDQSQRARQRPESPDVGLQAAQFV